MSRMTFAINFDYQGISKRHFLSCVFQKTLRENTGRFGWTSLCSTFKKVRHANQPDERRVRTEHHHERKYVCDF